MITINKLNGGDITITTTPPAAPSPYFAYDQDRVITGLYQGSPNVHVEGTYHDYDDGEEKSYSSWTYGGSDVVENYATEIGDNAFDNVSYVFGGTPPSKAITGNVTFQNIISIGNAAFYCDIDLTSMTIPNVRNIGSSAFSQCYSLTSMTIPNVASIRDYAFSGCQSLTSVTIGNEIQEIGTGAFEKTQGDPITLTIGKTVTEVQAMGTTDYDYITNVPYSNWGLSSGSTIVCTDGTISI